MIQFTASWCGVCRKEMPFIERDIWQRHKDNPNFVLIGIDRDEPLEKVVNFAKQTGVTYPLGLDPGANIYAKYALRKSGITRNILIDKDGTIIKRTRLYKEDEFSSLVETIDILNKKMHGAKPHAFFLFSFKLLLSLQFLLKHLWAVSLLLRQNGLGMAQQKTLHKCRSYQQSRPYQP